MQHTLRPPACSSFLILLLLF
uniref:Uncharacterized protein n=1 Tax=Anguilla anguilla TaxID=7936 RepID=A0A0E9VZD1_ANGAN